MAVAEQAFRRPVKVAPRDPTAGAFFWLSAFFVVYCARPEDWIPGLAYIPMAKISALFAVIGLLASVGKTRRSFKNLPIESKFLLAMIVLLFLWAPLSPVWKGGAVLKTFEFSKVYFAWVLTFLLVTTVARLRRLILIQATSVAVIAVISVLKGSNHPRLEGVINGIYSNPNDLAFAIVLTLPLILLLLLTSKSMIVKVAWAAAMLMMMYTLFRTASRAGFIDLVISGAVALWLFGVKGKRPQLILVTVVVGVLLLAVAGKHLRERFFAAAGSVENSEDQKAYGSFEERKLLMKLAVSGMMHYPLTGLGTGDFVPYTGKWKQVHVTYLQIGVEGGIPVLVLYLLFFYSAFRNLRKLRKKGDLDPQAAMFASALYCCLVGFVVGACFAPEAYQFFPYFTVAYTSALLATVKEQEDEGAVVNPLNPSSRFRNSYANFREERTVQPVR